MDKPQYRFQIDAESQVNLAVSIAATIIGCALVISEMYIGNSYTNIVVTLYLSFLIPAVALTKTVRKRFFFYMQDYIFAVRSFSAVMCTAFLIIWLIAIINHQNQLSPF